MKSKEKRKEKTFEEDYNKIIKDYQKHNFPISQIPQWINPGDFIIKFSLYKEMPKSITSTDISINFRI